MKKSTARFATPALAALLALDGVILFETVKTILFGRGAR